jgi:YidC/Oxa1 family membrane protein insertase
MQNIKHLSDPISAKVTAYRAEKKTAQAQAESQKLFALFREHKVNPLSGLWSMVQLPVFFGFFFAVKGIAELPVPGMSEGGLAWFPNLAVPDPYTLLPVLAGLSMLGALEAGPKVGDTAGAQAKLMRTLFRGMSVAMIFIMSSMPAAVSLYSVVSNGFTLLQVLALKGKGVRRVLGIPVVREVGGGAGRVAPKGNGFRIATPLSLGAAFRQLRASSAAAAAAVPAKTVGQAAAAVPSKAVGQGTVAKTAGQVAASPTTVKGPASAGKASTPSAASRAAVEAKPKPSTKRAHRASA